MTNANSIKTVRLIIDEVKKAVIGKDKIIIKILLAVLSKGHILLEDIPGVGKTTLALAFSKALSLDYNRVQFTPDVLPTDITGFTVYNKHSGSFEFKPGASMCNLLLADEINRTSSKTQSALLEIMEEGKVTVDGSTHELPKPFIVMATQNPIGSVGTQELPESQLDRFMIKISMGYPDLDSEIEILKIKSNYTPLDSISPVADTETLISLQKVVENVHVDDKIYSYIAKLAGATREHPMIKLGISTRGAIALMQISKATALLKGRDYVIPDDVMYMYHDVFSHRLILGANARINNVSAVQILDEIAGQVKHPDFSR
ncbi:MoxR family ATPase [Ruminococcus sp. HUN007]|uniref:AAA family ATPase n=1 Tax=Ruminococcus sp. HUN007 TaxID=1514668 RepID=UPI0005D1AE27|nr:MoxR family ATPase [Ruminococcus sp. HUN007]